MLGDTGAIQEGKAAGALGLKVTDNPYRKALSVPEVYTDDRAYGRYVALALCWESGFIYGKKA